MAVVPALPSPRTWASNDAVTAPRLRDVNTAITFHTTRPVFLGIQQVAQSIPASTWTAVTLDAFYYDTAGGHSNTANNSRYTAQVAGWYLVAGVVTYPSLTTANADTFICGARVNGTNNSTHLFEGTKHCGANSHNTQVSVLELVQLNVGDYVELGAFQVTGAAQTLVATNSATPTPDFISFLQVSWVAATSGTAGLSVPSEATWTDSNVVTSAAMNSNVRDAIRFLTYPPTVRLYYAGTTPASQAYPNNTWTAVSFDTATVDNYGGWGGTGSNPTRWTAPVAGHYLVAGYASFSNNTAGKRAVALRVNGTTWYYGQSLPVITASANDAGCCVLAQRLLKLNAGDYVETMGLQTSGGSLGLTTGTSSNRLISVWMCS